MNLHANKISENKSQAVANSLPKLRSNGKSAFQFLDNRPEAIVQRKQQEAINNSPHVQQLKAYQEMANNNTQVKQLRTYQAMADNFTSQTAQQKESLEEETLHGKFEPIQKKENNTGLPDNLKSGIENLSGYSMDDVKVHYNSDKPEKLEAHAYAQGTDIHLANGQEEHLPHEAWHVVQQKQGKVKPTMQMKDKVNVNNDAGLEKEADVMGAKAIEKGEIPSLQLQKKSRASQPLTQVIQKRALAANKMNVAGETHNESNAVRDQEKTYTEATTGGIYKQEGEFRTSKWALFGAERLGDPLMLRVEMLLAILREKILVEILNPFGGNQIPQRFVDAGIGHVDINTVWGMFRGELQTQLAEILTALNLAIQERAERTQAARAVNVHEALLALHTGMPYSIVTDVQTTIIPEIQRIIGLYAAEVLQAEDIRAENVISALRSEAMQEAAADNAAKIIGSQVGVWKVGEAHIPQIAQDKQGDAYDLLTKAEFNAGFNDWRAKVARRSEGLEENWVRLTQVALRINQPEAQQIIEEKRIRTRMLDIQMLSNQGSFIQFNIEMLSLIQDLPQLVKERKERSGDLLIAIAHSGLNRPPMPSL